MNKLGKKNKIKKSDYSRVLATESLPHETPIIFSNEGLYNNTRSASGNHPIHSLLLESLVRGKVPPKAPGSTIPFSYQIRKNALEFRKLSVIHPFSQWKIKEFYKKYELQLIYFCSRSPASIRAPKKIASTYYSKSSWDKINKYRTKGGGELVGDPLARFSPTYFAYSGYDRLYKFFDSKDYFELEKSYSSLLTLDVTRCFDSIYTHSMSWAIKDKKFTKKHVTISSTFAQEFDLLMQHTNHKETNGILIGPEVSRIFAEVLFQSVDLRVIARLEEEERQLEFGKQYVFRRYVDDVFIFAKSEAIALKVFECYSDTLSFINLHSNAAKSKRWKRPFITPKSRITREASREANRFLEKFLREEGQDLNLIPQKIHFTDRLARSFVDTVKSICSFNEVDYDEISSYLISVFAERIKKLVTNSVGESLGEAGLRNYRDSCLVLLDTLFFLYAVAPSVNASYKLCTSVIVLNRFAKNLGVHEHTVKQRIYELAEHFLSDEVVRARPTVEQFVSLEAINVMLAIRDLGTQYLLPEQTIRDFLTGSKKWSYFDIVSMLFYVQDEKEYKDVRRKVVRAADVKLRKLDDIGMNAEKACLFLDMMTCPYVHHDQKSIWLRRLFPVLQKAVPSVAEIGAYLAGASKRPWFVNWMQPDLLGSLENKELKKAY